MKRQPIAQSEQAQLAVHLQGKVQLLPSVRLELENLAKSGRQGASRLFSFSGKPLFLLNVPADKGVSAHFNGRLFHQFADK